MTARTGQAAPPALARARERRSAAPSPFPAGLLGRREFRRDLDELARRFDVGWRDGPSGATGALSGEGASAAADELARIVGWHGAEGAQCGCPRERGQ